MNEEDSPTNVSYRSEPKGVLDTVIGTAFKSPNVNSEEEKNLNTNNDLNLEEKNGIAVEIDNYDEMSKDRTEITSTGAEMIQNLSTSTCTEKTQNLSTSTGAEMTSDPNTSTSTEKTMNLSTNDEKSQGLNTSTRAEMSQGFSTVTGAEKSQGFSTTTGADVDLRYLQNDGGMQQSSELDISPQEESSSSEKESESESDEDTDDYNADEYKLYGSRPMSLQAADVIHTEGQEKGDKSDNNNQQTPDDALIESVSQKDETSISHQMGGSRRSKAFKTKMTFRRCKVTSDDPDKLNQEWSVMASDDSDDYLDDLQYNKTINWPNDQNDDNEDHNRSLYGNQIFETQFSAEDIDKRIKEVTGFEHLGVKHHIDDTSGEHSLSLTTAREITESALDYFQRVSSAALILQSSQKTHVKTKKKKKKTKWTEKNIKIIDGKKWRECGKCAKLFKTRREIREHNKLHKNVEDIEPDVRIIDGKRWRECSECKKLFRTRKELRIHFRIHTNEKPYECEVCGKGFKQLAHMNSHLKIHSGEKPYSCEICGMNFSEKSSLKRHIRRHLGIRPFKCQICGNEYYTSTLLKSHMNAHLIKTGEIESFTCHICGKKYSRKETLNKHLKIHDPEKRIRCEICDGTFLTHSHLKRHKLTHLDNVQKSFYCGECGKEFLTSSGLKAHLQTHNTERNFKCDHCDWAFRDKQSLTRHIVIHDPIANMERRKYKCEQCDKLFVSQGNLTEHMKSHNKPADWPFKCDICKKTYRRRSYLKNHMLNHDSKPHKCEECDKSYAFKKSLMEHIKHTHTPPPEGSEKFCCPDCPKYFSRKDSLTSHMKVHSDMAVSCDICNKKFVRPSALATHRISHSSERTNCCVICAAAFKFKKNLNRHMIQVHGVNPKEFAQSLARKEMESNSSANAPSSDTDITKIVKDKSKQNRLKIKFISDSQKKRKALEDDQLSADADDTEISGDEDRLAGNTSTMSERSADGHDSSFMRESGLEDKDNEDVDMESSDSQYSDMINSDEDENIQILKDKDDSAEQFLSKIQFEESLDQDQTYSVTNYNNNITDNDLSDI